MSRDVNRAGEDRVYVAYVTYLVSATATANGQSIQEMILMRKGVNGTHD